MNKGLHGTAQVGIQTDVAWRQLIAIYVPISIRVIPVVVGNLVLAPFTVVPRFLDNDVVNRAPSSGDTLKVLGLTYNYNLQ